MNGTAISEVSQQLYDELWRAQLEASHLHQYVAVEPIAVEYFLGNSLSTAIQAARKKYPDRLTYVIRIGHQTAIHLGAFE